MRDAHRAPVGTLVNLTVGERRQEPRRPRVVVAEADPVLRALLVQALRADDYDVVAVGGGPDLLRLMASTWGKLAGLDLLVSDTRIRGWNGVELVEGLRAIGWKAPVVLMSSSLDAEMRARVLTTGALLFRKPLDVEELRAAVRWLLRDARR